MVSCANSADFPHMLSPMPLRRRTIAAVFALILGPFLVVTGASGAEPASKFSTSMLDRQDLNDKDKVRVSKIVPPTTDFTKPERFEAMQGGAGTSRRLVNRNAFSHFAENMTFAQERDFKLGNALFRKLWVAAPASTQASDGLGPLYNARSCQSCHLKDGRGRPPEANEPATSMFLRLARPAGNAEEQGKIDDGLVVNFPDPIYGSQLQNFAIAGVPSEGNMIIEYDYQSVSLKGGEVAELRRPHYRVGDLSHGPLNPKTTLSPRIAPAMIGLGLIEQIHEADLIAKSDPSDKDKDGISGKLQLVRNPKNNLMQVGRFGWKAQNFSILMQSASALAGDIGISNPLFPKHAGDCTASQQTCLNAPTGIQSSLGTTEAPDPILDLITFYSQNLAVPRRRNVNMPSVLRGKAIFHELGCTNCHTPKYVTRRDAPDAAHRFQLIWPYSDFLLHDMGTGLADGQQVGRATGNEWRTPPLWGIGLTQSVSGHTYFLHDGRARNLTEAILWHGGEAENSKQQFIDLPKGQRNALIKFLESL